MRLSSQQAGIAGIGVGPVRGLDDPMAAESGARTLEVVRGFLLICVFQAHVLFDVVDLHPESRWAWFQIKLLAPDIALFFLLSGMSARDILRKRFASVLTQSLFLLVLAVVSHLVGAVPFALMDGQWRDPAALLPQIVKPVFYGTGYVNYVAWFFIVLALTRLIVFGLLRRTVTTAVLIVIGALLCYGAGRWLGEPNFYEWRNLPASVLLFFVGMKLPRAWRPPVWLLALTVLAWVPVAMLNNPDLLSTGFCFTCDLRFSASTMYGEYGNVPVYLLYLAISFTMLHGLGQRLAGSWAADVLRFFGRNSLQILVMHGWLLIGLHTYLVQQLPAWDRPLLYAAVFFVNTALHGGIYILLRAPIRWLIGMVMRLTRIILAPILSAQTPAMTPGPTRSDAASTY